MIISHRCARGRRGLARRVVRVDRHREPPDACSAPWRRCRTTSASTCATRRCSRPSATACSRRSARRPPTSRAGSRRSATSRRQAARSCSPASPPGYEVDRFLVAKVLLTGVGVGARVSRLTRCSGLTAVLWLFVMVLGSPSCASSVPTSCSTAQDRRPPGRDRTQPPDTLDLLVISVEAGLGFEQALERTASAVPGPLSEELRRMLQETRMGASRADALARPSTSAPRWTTCGRSSSPCCRPTAFGVSVARILRSQADEIRLRRRRPPGEVAEGTDQDAVPAGVSASSRRSSWSSCCRRC